MSLPASGNISLLQIKAEFGGPGNILSYYKGGAFVASTTVNAAVPTSGIITIDDFLGASNGVMQLTAFVGAYQTTYNVNGYVSSSSGLASANGGSVAPTTVNGKTVTAVETDNQQFNPNWEFQVIISTGVNNSNFFTKVAFTGANAASNGGSVFFNTANAFSTSYTAPNQKWTWRYANNDTKLLVAALFNSGTVYALTFT